MKKQILGLMLVTVLLLSMIPFGIMTASAETGFIYVGNEKMSAGDIIGESDSYAKFDGTTLTLHNYNYKGEGYRFSDSSELFNKATVKTYWCGLIYAEIPLTLKLEGENSLSFVDNTYTGKIDYNKEGYYEEFIGQVIKTRAGVTIIGDGALTISSNSKDISSGDYITIDSGSFEFVGTGGGIVAANDITINNGSFDFKVADASISANTLTINGGVFDLPGKISTASGRLTITNGVINASSIYSQEGNIYINGGDIYISSETNAIEAAKQGVYVEPVNYLELTAISTATTSKDDKYWAIKGGSSGTFIHICDSNTTASTAPNGVFEKFASANLTTYDHINIVAKEVTRAFTTQPVGGEVSANGAMTVNWALNFQPVKLAVVTSVIGPNGSPFYQIAELSNIAATSLELGANFEGGSYEIRAYYGTGESDFVSSEPFSVTEIAKPEPDQTYLPGDIDGNGTVEADDYILLKRVFFGTAKDVDPSICDIDGNGKVEADDYILLKRVFFGTAKL